jgi:hypothetical protein
MAHTKLIKKLKQKIKNDKYIFFSDEEFNILDSDDIEKILSVFAGKYLFRLPESEIIFFE